MQFTDLNDANYCKSPSSHDILNKHKIEITDRDQYDSGFNTILVNTDWNTLINRKS